MHQSVSGALDYTARAVERDVKELIGAEGHNFKVDGGSLSVHVYAGMPKALLFHPPGFCLGAVKVDKDIVNCPGRAY